MTTLQLISLDDQGSMCLTRTPMLRAGAAVIAMVDVHDALRHRREDLAEAKIVRARSMLATAVGAS